MSQTEMTASVKNEAELRVFKYLRDEMGYGRLKAGVKLPSERSLVDVLGISRGYVRKALAKLEHYGLIKTLPKSGTIVADLGPKAITGLIAAIGNLDDAFDPSSLFEIRNLLEVFAAGQAARKCDKEGAAEILKWHGEFKAKADNGERALEEDHLFHLAIAKASGNPVCISLVSFITPQIISLNADFAESDPNRFAHTFEEHAAIVKGILGTDPAAAEQAMRYHMQQAWKRRLPGTALGASASPEQEAMSGAISGDTVFRALNIGFFVQENGLA
ncbi:MAG: FCD domain-containing protein [Spirochaetales bacterium]|nr:FCD domain-containing protein [Spirochaetales bacterium]